MPKLVFYACSALVGQVVKRRECRVWFEDPDAASHDPGKLVSINLAMSPAELDPAHWSSIQVDDHVRVGGATTIGPEFPGGDYEGGIYLVEALWREHKTKILFPPVKKEEPDPGQPPLRPIHDHEFQSLLHRDGGAGTIRRYHGFHAIQLSIQGSIAVVRIFEPGADVPKGPFGIQLADVSECDPSANGHTQIGLPGVTEGALFLSWAKARQLELRMPKLPPSQGNRSFPVR